MGRKGKKKRSSSSLSLKARNPPSVEQCAWCTSYQRLATRSGISSRSVFIPRQKDPSLISQNLFLHSCHTQFLLAPVTSLYLRISLTLSIYLLRCLATLLTQISLLWKAFSSSYVHSFCSCGHAILFITSSTPLQTAKCSLILSFFIPSLLFTPINVIWFSICTVFILDFSFHTIVLLFFNTVESGNYFCS